MEDDHYQPHCHPKELIVLIVPNMLVSQIETLNCDICMFFSVISMFSIVEMIEVFILDRRPLEHSYFICNGL